MCLTAYYLGHSLDLVDIVAMIFQANNILFLTLALIIIVMHSYVLGKRCYWKCWFVCLLVSNIPQKVMNGLQ